MSSSTRILRKDTKNNKWNIEKILNIFMSQGYTNCWAPEHVGSYSISINKPYGEGYEDNQLPEHSRDENMIIYISFFEDWCDKFYCSEENIYYYSFIFFEEIVNREIMLLNFLHEYFQLFPEDIFWDCDKLYFTKEDIDKIYNKGDLDRNWLYKKP